VIVAAAAIFVASLLAALPIAGAGTGAPIAIGAGVLAVGFTAWSVTTGASPPLLIAALLLFGESAGVILFGAGWLALVPITAAGLYLVIELSVRSLEIRGKQPGWRDFRWSDILSVGSVAALVALMAWFVTILATGTEPPGGIFMHAVGIAAAAAVIGAIWLLVGREDQASG
jgi:hypothetical protein